MKAQEVITQLYQNLPKYTDLFSDTFAITSLTQVAGTATAITTAAHGLSIGSVVTIVGAVTEAPIVTLTRTTTTLFVETSIDHDLTYNPRVDDDQFITLSGAFESEFNGTFQLTKVTNRRNFELRTTDSGATVATGSPIAEDVVKSAYNGQIVVTGVPSAISFEYSVDSALPSPASGFPVLHRSIRVTGVVQPDRIVALYTEHPPQDLWAFVVLNDAIASKDRDIQNDATTAQTGNTFRNQKIIQSFSVYVVSPCDDELAARQSRDLMEDIYSYLNKSLLGTEFSTGFFSNKKWITTSLGHNFQLYNGAYYMHEFPYEQVGNLLFEDSIGRPVDVAFRDINLTQTPDVGNEPLTATIDLDEVPL